jgi:predicted nucleic-acid-binding Zn-ribbon protein
MGLRKVQNEMTERKCCPDCGRTEIYQRQPSYVDTNTPEETYHCEICYFDFDEPDTKEVDSVGYHGDVQKLLEADPEIRDS